MNQALAEYEAANDYPTKNKHYLDVETAMQILANAGYNSKNWKCLTSGYEIYWDRESNKMVLYNSSTAEIEYPEEYIGTKDINVNAVNGRWQIYNGNYEAAFSYDFSFSSSSDNGKLSGTSLSSVDKEANSGAAALSAALSGESADTIKSTIGLQNDTVYINASKTEYSSSYNVANASATSYAKIDSYYISNSEEITLDNTGSLKANTYVVSVVADKDGFVSTEAKQAAGEFVYALFVQMNAGVTNNDASIIVPEGTTIDVSKHEWKSADIFSGYFGVADSDNDGSVEPVVIDGARLTTATGHALTYKLDGSASKYCCTGFFGAIYGETTIENVTFTNLSIEEPGWDFVVASGKNNRNCVALIGAIIPNPSKRDEPVNVTIKNVKVENTTVKGIGSVGGIVGYIGAEQSYENLKGNVKFENVTFSGDIQSTDSFYVATGYSPVGGILGFTCRCDDSLNIYFNNCTFNGTAKGYGSVGGLVGNHKNGTIVIENSVSSGTLEVVGACTNTEKYDKDDVNYGTYKIGDYKYYGKVVGTTGVVLGKKDGGVSRFEVDGSTLTNSNIGTKTIVGSKGANDRFIKLEGIEHFVGIGDTFVSGTNLDNEYVFFDMNSSAVTTTDTAFVSYLAKDGTTNEYKRTNSFTITQYTSEAKYEDIQSKLITLNGVTFTDYEGAIDTQGNKYDVIISVNANGSKQTSGTYNGLYKYDYKFTFKKVVGDQKLDLVLVSNTNSEKIPGYSAGGDYCYESIVRNKITSTNPTTTKYYKDNIASQVEPYSVITYTVKASY